MKKISVNIEKLEDKIQKIKELKADCENIDVSIESQVGSGNSIEIIHLIDKEYSLLKKSIELLLQNSISFFENIKESMIEADTEASANIK